MRTARIIGARARTTGGTVAVWIALLALYLLFSGSVSLHEAAAGAVCAGLATLWWRAVGRSGSRRFGFGGDAVRPAIQAVFGLPRETLRVGGALVRAALGGPRSSIGTRNAASIPWAGAESTVADRALGLTAASLSPGSYVLRLDAARGEVVEHRFGGEA